MTDIATELDKKLDPKNVKPPAPGRFGEYVEGWFVIAESNRIFGWDGWNYSVDSLLETSRELVTISNQRGEYKQWRVTYVATVTVDVSDVKRQDVGAGHGQAKEVDLGGAIDSAVKEAVTDALKRALRTFGWPFGLALYDKTKAHVGVDTPSGNGAQSGLADAWIDGIKDGLSENASPQQFADACAAQLEADFNKMKSVKGLRGQWSKRETVITWIEQKFPDIWREIVAAYERRDRELDPPPADPSDQYDASDYLRSG